MQQFRFSAAHPLNRYHITGIRYFIHLEVMMQTPVQKPRDRNFFAVVGRAYDAYREFERLSMMSDEALAARNMTRDEISHYILTRL